MKICLIIPPSPFLLDERVFMQLGILKIAAVLERNNYKVDVVDLSGVENYLTVLEDYFKMQDHAKIVGITATTPQVPYAVKISNTIRNKANKIILGGPHVTLMHTAAKREARRNFEGSDRASRDIEMLQGILMSWCVAMENVPYLRL
jgi:anaerobic magnesium-protoporphyrin IX monomethyl ester cyclase